MSSIFNFNRFAKVLNYDIKRSVQNYGLAMIILIMMPYIHTLLVGMFSLVIDGVWRSPSATSRWIMFGMACFLFVLSYGVSSYGYLTDKKAGSDYVLLPASVTEKFLSMVLNCAFIAPIVFAAAYLLNDWVVVKTGLADGNDIITGSSFINGDNDIYVNIWVIGFISLSINILCFLLGAIFFAKRKVPMTLLVLLGLQILIIPVVIAMAKSGLSIDGDVVPPFCSRYSGDIELLVNSFIYISIIVEYILLLVLIFFRIKTIKH